MILLANILSTIGYLLALAILLGLLLRRSHRYFGRKKPNKIEGLVRVDRPAPKRPWSSNLDSPGQVAKFEVQLQETMRELSAQLDNKMVCLQVLLRQADEKIRRLEQLQQSEMNNEAASTPTAGFGANSSSAAVASAIDPAHQQIYGLADQGFSPVTIAHRVSRPLREVEAILQIRKGN